MLDGSHPTLHGNDSVPVEDRIRGLTDSSIGDDAIAATRRPEKYNDACGQCDDRNVNGNDECFAIHD